MKTQKTILNTLVLSFMVTAVAPAMAVGSPNNAFQPERDSLAAIVKDFCSDYPKTSIGIGIAAIATLCLYKLYKRMTTISKKDFFTMDAEELCGQGARDIFPPVYRGKPKSEMTINYSEKNNEVYLYIPSGTSREAFDTKLKAAGFSNEDCQGINTLVREFPTRSLKRFTLNFSNYKSNLTFLKRVNNIDNN